MMLTDDEWWDLVFDAFEVQVIRAGNQWEILELVPNVYHFIYEPSDSDTPERVDQAALDAAEEFRGRVVLNHGWFYDGDKHVALLLAD